MVGHWEVQVLLYIVCKVAVQDSTKFDIELIPSNTRPIWQILILIQMWKLFIIKNRTVLRQITEMGNHVDEMPK